MADNDQRAENEVDATVPSEERQAELAAAVQTNVQKHMPPYDGVIIRTLGELHWIRHKNTLSDAPDGEPEAPLNLERVVFEDADLQDVDLRHANLRNASFRRTCLRGALLNYADLSGVDMGGEKRGDALDARYTCEVDLAHAQLVDSKLCGAILDGVDLSEVRGWRADFSHATVRGATLFNADFGRANFNAAHLDYADCKRVVVSGATMYGTHLDGADLRGADVQDARFDVTTDLKRMRLDSDTKLSDILWNGVPLTRIEWDGVQRLGDENEADQSRDKAGKLKVGQQRLWDYQAAYRAYQQLSLALRSQGLREPADRFAFQAQKLQCVVFRRQGNWGWWLFWWFLRGLAGFGYRPKRTVYCYLLLVVISTWVYCWQAAMFVHSGTPGQDIFGTAIVDALTALHGRGFFPTPAESGWQMGMAAFDAVAGLVIEASFIATFTQRFFAR